MADHGVLLVGRDRRVRHAGEVVVGRVVGAHVVEAELEVTPLLAAALRRPEGSQSLAAGMLADRAFRLARLVALRLDADAVEEGRIEIHDAAIMRGPTIPGQGLNAFGRSPFDRGD